LITKFIFQSLLGLFWILNFSFDIRAQEKGIFSLENRILFADFLYCEKDFLRASEEYLACIPFLNSDTVFYKLGNSLLKIGEIAGSQKYFNEINKSSDLYNYSQSKIFESYFLTGNNDILSELKNGVQEPGLLNQIDKFIFLSSLIEYGNVNIIEDNVLLFPEIERNKINDFVRRVKQKEEKSPLLAGIFSTLLPGSGKIYTDNISDGITAFILTGLFGYLSYSNFKADHDFRGYLFSGVSLFFYSGNIYGSVISAKIFNEEKENEFRGNLYNYLEEKSYFSEDKFESCGE